MVFDGKTNEGLIAHSDSNWAMDVNNCRSVFFFFFFGVEFIVYGGVVTYMRHYFIYAL